MNLTQSPNGETLTKSEARRRQPGKAHRFSWYMIHGYFPENILLHSCDNPKCVNPNHLREGTNKENSEDMIKRGRSAAGEKSGRSKLTEQQVKIIRNDPRPQNIIALQYGLCQQSVSLIKRKINWKYMV